MKPRRFRSFAKINLGLEVVGRRADGYHELKTLFASVTLHDLIEIAPSGREIVIRSAHPDLPTGEANLAYRAAAAMRRLAHTRTGLVITIHKRIPVGGGLGGGSSNAATVLRALDRLWGLGLGASGLREEARALGADVPYFLVGGPALGLGRGDDIHPVPLSLPGAVVLVPGAGGVGTAAVFRRLAALDGPRKSASRIDAFLRSVRAGGSPSLRTLRNDLEAAAVAECPRLSEVARRVRRVGRAVSAREAALSGSGSSFFLLLDDPKDARRASSSLRREGLESVRGRFVSRRSFESRFEVRPGERG